MRRKKRRSGAGAAGGSGAISVEAAAALAGTTASIADQLAADGEGFAAYDEDLGPRRRVRARGTTESTATRAAAAASKGAAYDDARRRAAAGHKTNTSSVVRTTELGTAMSTAAATATSSSAGGRPRSVARPLGTFSAQGVLAAVSRNAAKAAQVRAFAAAAVAAGGEGEEEDAGLVFTKTTEFSRQLQLRAEGTADAAAAAAAAAAEANDSMSVDTSDAKGAAAPTSDDMATSQVRHGVSLYASPPSTITTHGSYAFHTPHTHAYIRMHSQPSVGPGVVHDPRLAEAAAAVSSSASTVAGFGNAEPLVRSF